MRQTPLNSGRRIIFRTGGQLSTQHKRGKSPDLTHLMKNRTVIDRRRGVPKQRLFYIIESPMLPDAGEQIQIARRPCPL